MVALSQHSRSDRVKIVTMPAPLVSDRTVTGAQTDKSPGHTGRHPCIRRLRAFGRTATGMDNSEVSLAAGQPEIGEPVTERITTPGEPGLTSTSILS